MGAGWSIYVGTGPTLRQYNIFNIKTYLYLILIFITIVASLLTCLYQLKNENVNLEDELAGYTKRRDHLLAVNARLAIPLPPQSNFYIQIYYVIRKY